MNKGCIFCCGEERICSDDNNVEILLKEEQEVLYYGGGYGWQREGLNFIFCPICGSKLKERE